jgi:general secretion pathway protein G
MNEDQRAAQAAQGRNTPMHKQTLELRLRAARRAASRGVTLVEVLIVVAIMALIAGGVSFMILPKYREAQIDTARTNARSIRQVAMQFMALKGGDCPSVETLIAEKELDSAGNTEDPWGSPYKISCGDDDISVVSAGPDKSENTEDDVVVGPASGES